MEQHILSAENLHLGYDGRVIVDSMEAVIPDGKISIIIGANGCGKSTLLKSFARLLRPISGMVTLDRRPIGSYQPKKLAQILGLLPQSPVVPEGIKVADLVARGSSRRLTSIWICTTRRSRTWRPTRMSTSREERSLPPAWTLLAQGDHLPSSRVLPRSLTRYQE